MASSFQVSRAFWCLVCIFCCSHPQSTPSLSPDNSSNDSLASADPAPAPQPVNLTNGNGNATSYSLPALASLQAFSNVSKAVGDGIGSTLAMPSLITPVSPAVVAKQTAFDHKNIPARPVHMAGAGAYGTFTVTTKFAQTKTQMSLFSNVGQKTPVTVRFSNALGEKGSFDTARNVRGFAIKFHTSDGVWDLLCNNAPMFFIRDPAKFPDLIQSQSRDPTNNLANADSAFNYFPSNPETLNLFLRIFSSAGTSRGWVHTSAWSGNTYRWYKRDGTWSYVRITLETMNGVVNFTAAEQAQISDPSLAARELYTSIQTGKFPRWTLYAQVLSPKEAENFRYNVLDATKEWPVELVTPQEIGTFELNKNVGDYFAEVEKQAFSPTNMIPGWAASQDPVLQMRLYAYGDSSRYRLGTTSPSSSQPRKRRSTKAVPTPTLIQPAAPAYDATHSTWINNALRSMNQILPIDFEQPNFFYGNLSQSQKTELIQNIAGGLSVVSSSDVRTSLIGWLSKANSDLSNQVSQQLARMIS